MDEIKSKNVENKIDEIDSKNVENKIDENEIKVKYNSFEKVVDKENDVEFDFSGKVDNSEYEKVDNNETEKIDKGKFVIKYEAVDKRQNQSINNKENEIRSEKDNNIKITFENKGGYVNQSIFKDLDDVFGTDILENQVGKKYDNRTDKEEKENENILVKKDEKINNESSTDEDDAKDDKPRIKIIFENNDFVESDTNKNSRSDDDLYRNEIESSSLNKETLVYGGFSEESEFGFDYETFGNSGYSEEGTEVSGNQGNHDNQDNNYSFMENKKIRKISFWGIIFELMDNKPNTLKFSLLGIIVSILILTVGVKKTLLILVITIVFNFIGRIEDREPEAVYRFRFMKDYVYSLYNSFKQLIGKGR